MHFPYDLFFFPDSGFAEVVALLQIQPELRASPEIMSQTQSGLWSNGAPAVRYLADAGCRDTNVHRELILADLQGLEKLFKQHDARMGGYGAELPAQLSQPIVAPPAQPSGIDRLRYVWPLRRETAVESQGLSGVIRRFLREQPCNRVGNFFRATDTANGMNAPHLIERPFAAKYFQQHFGSYCARTDGIDPNSVSAVFDCGGFG
jgi:hypothetical protein